MFSGQQVSSTVRLVRPLGQGGMGRVWVADHLALGTQVAVKFMAPEYAQDQELVARFRREATIAAQLKSPHVAQVLDHGATADGQLYIVMELLDGEDLKSRVHRYGPLQPAEVALIIGHAAKALNRAHQRGIVHIGHAAKALNRAHQRGIVHREMVPPGRLGRAWKVDPGEHAVAAAAEQFQMELKTVQVNEGEWTRVTIPLRPLPPAPSMMAPTAPESSAWRDTGARIMFAGGAVALGAGAFSGAIASKNDWDRTGTAVSVASFIAGGIFIAGGVALTVWPRATNSNVRVSWGAAPTWIGIRCAF